MEHVVHSFNGLLAITLVTDVAFDKSKTLPLFCGDAIFNVVQVVLVTGGKVV